MDGCFIPPPESLITLAEWQQTPASVQQRVIGNSQLRETVEVLQALIHRNSQNSMVKKPDLRGNMSLRSLAVVIVDNAPKVCVQGVNREWP
jgi:hypothetical protein